jgi:hypothetical protein
MVQENDPSAANAVEATLFISPDLASNRSIVELRDELASAGLPAQVQVHDALAVRGGVHEIWLALSTDMTPVMLGAAGAGVWQAVASVFGRLFSGRSGRCSFALRAEGKTAKVDLDLSSSASEMAETLLTLPEILRAATGS